MKEVRKYKTKRSRRVKVETRETKSGVSMRISFKLPVNLLAK